MIEKVCRICLKGILDNSRYDGYHNSCVTNLTGSIAVSPYLSFDKTIFRAERSQGFTRGMSISGVQKKLSLTVKDEMLQLTSIDGKYILKPTVDDYPELSGNEHLTMRLGELFGIQTPPCGLLEFTNKELAYVVRRFDWVDNHTKILKEDMAQIFQLNRDADQIYKYSKSYEEVGNKIKEITGHKMAQVLDFYKRVVFAFVSGNGDYHLKNISVQNRTFNKSGIFDELTPNYDSVMTALYFPAERETALDLLKEGGHSSAFDEIGFITKPDFVLLGQRMGLLIPAINLVFSSMRARIPQAKELIRRGFLSNEMKEKYLTIFEQRAKRLELIDA